MFLSCMPPWRDVHSATPWLLLWMPTRFHWDKMWRSVILENEEYTKPNCIYEDSMLLLCLGIRVLGPKCSLFLAFRLSVHFSELSIKPCVNLRLTFKIWTILSLNSVQPYNTDFFCRLYMRFFSINLKDFRYYELTFNLFLQFWAQLATYACHIQAEKQKTWKCRDYNQIFTGLVFSQVRNLEQLKLDL